jgi:hypothetical protein
MNAERITRDAPDRDFAGYPANLKAGYRIFGAGWVFHLTFKYLVKSKINKSRCNGIEGFRFPSLKHSSTGSIFIPKQ